MFAIAKSKALRQRYFSLMTLCLKFTVFEPSNIFKPRINFLYKHRNLEYIFFWFCIFAQEIIYGRAEILFL